MRKWFALLAVVVLFSLVVAPISHNVVPHGHAHDSQIQIELMHMVLRAEYILTYSLLIILGVLFFLHRLNVPTLIAVLFERGPNRGESLRRATVAYRWFR